MFIAVLLLFFFVLIGLCAPCNGPGNPPAQPAPQSDKDKKQEEKEEIFVASDGQEAQLRFNKQCWLIDKFEEISSLAYTNFEHFSMITGDPSLVTNELVTKKRASPLLNIKPSEIALLTPRIRLFFVREFNGVEEEKEIHFSADFGTKNVSAEDLFKSGDLRGEGAGVKSFSYDLAGVNPAEAESRLLLGGASPISMRSNAEESLTRRWPRHWSNQKQPCGYNLLTIPFLFSRRVTLN